MAAKKYIIHVDLLR